MNSWSNAEPDACSAFRGVCEDGDALKARIDAVATMLQFGKPTIDDLANAEIAYAPPFASAMDAVNAVANVADNILSGQLKPISSKEFGELWKDRANNNVFFADARPAVAGNATAAKYPRANGTPSRWKTLKRSSTPSPRIARWPSCATPACAPTK